MFSPAKAIIAGALVFGLSAAFLIARPFDQQGGVPGAEQVAEPPVPVEVTGGLGVVGECDEPEDGPANTVCEVDLEWSEPRLLGADRAMMNNGSIDLPDGSTLQVFNKVHNIVTDKGVWRMRPQIRFEFEGSLEVQEGPEWWVLDGDGDWEGLSLLLIRGDGDKPMRGFMISTELLPPPPEGASTK